MRVERVHPRRAQFVVGHVVVFQDIFQPNGAVALKPWELARHACGSTNKRNRTRVAQTEPEEPEEPDTSESTQSVERKQQHWYFKLINKRSTKK